MSVDNFSNKDAKIRDERSEYLYNRVPVGDSGIFRRSINRLLVKNDKSLSNNYLISEKNSYSPMRRQMPMNDNKYYYKFRELLNHSQSRQKMMSKRNYNLQNHDIPGAKPNAYKKLKGRDYINVADIDGTSPKKTIPFHAKRNLILDVNDINDKEKKLRKLGITKEQLNNIPEFQQYYLPQLDKNQAKHLRYQKDKELEKIYGVNERAKFGKLQLENPLKSKSERPSKLNHISQSPKNINYENPPLTVNERPNSNVKKIVDYEKSKSKFFGYEPPQTKEIIRTYQSNARNRSLEEERDIRERNESPFTKLGREVMRQDLNKSYEIGKPKEETQLPRVPSTRRRIDTNSKRMNQWIHHQGESKIDDYGFSQNLNNEYQHPREEYNKSHARELSMNDDDFVRQSSVKQMMTDPIALNGNKSPSKHMYQENNSKYYVPQEHQKNELSTYGQIKNKKNRHAKRRLKDLTQFDNGQKYKSLTPMDKDQILSESLLEIKKSESKPDYSFIKANQSRNIIFRPQVSYGRSNIDKKLIFSMEGGMTTDGKKQSPTFVSQVPLGTQNTSFSPILLNSPAFKI